MSQNFVQKATGASPSGLTDSLLFDNGTNVGIGTSAPSYALEVISKLALTGADTELWLIRTSGASFLIQAGSGSNPTVIRNTSNNPLSFWTNDIERVRVDTNGNVGIGTSSPSRKLDVAGTAVFAGAFANAAGDEATWGLNVYDTTAAAAGVGGGLSFRGLISGLGSNSHFAAIQGAKENATDANRQGTLRFFTAPNTGLLAERTRIDSAGNVGIGTTSPAAKLDVRGTVYIGGDKGIQVDEYTQADEFNRVKTIPQVGTIPKHLAVYAGQETQPGGEYKDTYIGTIEYADPQIRTIVPTAKLGEPTTDCLRWAFCWQIMRTRRISPFAARAKPLIQCQRTSLRTLVPRAMCSPTQRLG